MAKSKNSGFTLMELLLVIVIMGIAAGFMYLSVANVSSSAARKAASDTDYLLSRCRSACLSRKGGSYIELRDNGEACVLDYYEGGTFVESKELSGTSGSCTYNGGTKLTADGIKIGFQRSTGAEKTGEDYTTVSSIEFSGGGTSYQVFIVPETGSHGIS